MEASTYQTSTFYNQEWANKWQDMKAFSPVARHTRRLIRKLLNTISFRSLVDVGCGNGALLQEIDRDWQGLDLYGVDFSDVALDLTRRQVPGRFHRLDIVADSLDETFDVAVCSEVLEHLEDDCAALRNIREMAHQVIITVPGGPLGPSSVAMGHVRHYTREGLSKKLEEAGFRVRKIRSWGTPFHDPLYAWLRGKAPETATTGDYGWARRMATRMLYLLFFLNVIDAGHKLVALAERAHGNSEGSAQ